MERHLELLTELICVWTPDGRLAACNDAYCAFFGATRDELLGRPWPDLIQSGSREGADALVTDMGRNPQQYRAERLTANAAGDLRWLEWIGQPIFDQDGTLTEVLSEGRDVTERKKAEEAARESESRYRRLFDEATEGMVLTDADTGVAEDCNRAFLRLTGFDRLDVAGRALPLVEESTGRPFLPGQVGNAEEGQCRTVRARLTTKNGDVRDVLVKGGFVHLAGRRLFHAFVDDVTEAKLAERYRDATLVLLRLLNEEDRTRELLRQLTDLLRQWSGCEAVAVRLREGEDFTFHESHGFPSDFVRTERRLCRYDAAGHLVVDEAGNPVLDCLCGRVAGGKADTSVPGFTEHGSFWTNAAGGVDGASGMTRGRCVAQGFESLAIIPMRQGDDTIGLLQLCDRAPGRLNASLIEFVESASDQLAIALSQKSKLSSLEGGLRQIAALLAEIGVSTGEARQPLTPALRVALASLSRRETEVLRLLLRNRRPTTIAKELSRSVHTVRNQLKAIFKKLNVHSQEELLSRLGSNPDLVMARAADTSRAKRA
jgi:PAS domain S-box-containing protein